MARSLHIRPREITGPIAVPTPRLDVRDLWASFMHVCVRPAFPGARLSDVAPFFRSLATLVGAGISLYQALESASRQTRNPVLSKVASDAAARVLGGGRLSEVLAEKPYLFSVLHVELIRFAEEAGKLDTTLHLIADFAERELELRRLISRLTIYPKLLAVVAILICGRALFGGGSMAIVSLVLGGSGLAYLADTVGLIAQVLFLALSVVAVVRILLFRSSVAREMYEVVKMTMPGLGGCVKRFAFARFGRALGAVYQAGIPLYSGLRIAGAACGSVIISRAVDRMIQEVDRGAGLTEAARASGVFPPVVLQMLETGEQTGNLDTMMGKVAEYLEGEAETRANQNAWIFSVAVYLIVAIVIASFIIGAWGGYSAQMTAAAAD